MSRRHGTTHADRIYDEEDATMTRRTAPSPRTRETRAGRIPVPARRGAFAVGAALLVLFLLAVCTSPANAWTPWGGDDDPENYSLYKLASNATTYFGEKNAPDQGDLQGNGSKLDPKWNDVTTDAASGGSLLGYADPDFSVHDVVGWFFAEVSGSSQTVTHKTFDVGGYSGILDYSHFGAANQDLGLDTMYSGIGGQVVAMIGGSLIWLMYGTAMMVSTVFWVIIQMLKAINPFTWFYQAVQAINPTFADGMVQGSRTPDALGGLQLFVSKWYGILNDIAWHALVPLFLGFLLIGLILFRKMDRGSAVKKFIVRIVFIGVGLPLIGSMYTSVLNKFDDSILGQSSGPTRVVLSTYVDFEAWMMHDRLGIPDAAVIGWDKGQASSQSMMAVRTSALAINAQANPSFSSYGNGLTRPGDAQVAWSKGTVGVVSSTADDARTVFDTFGILNDYIGSRQVAASDFESQIKTSVTRLDADDDEKKSWFVDKDSYGDVEKFGEEQGPEPAQHPIISVPNGLRSSDPGGDTTVFETTGIRSGCGAKVLNADGSRASCNLSPLAAYNYLNTEFGNESLTMYSSNNATSGFNRSNHMAVSQVGTGPAKFMYWYNAGTILGCISILGIVYAIGMLIGSIKRTFGLVAAIPFATLGALAAIAKVLVYSSALILEVIVTLFMYQFVSEFLISVPDIIAGPMSTFVSPGGPLGSSVLVGPVVVIMTLMSSLIILGVTIGLLKARRQVLQAMDETFTKLVDKFLDTNTLPAMSPPKTGGLLPALAGGLGAGAGMAAGQRLASGLGKLVDQKGRPGGPNGPGTGPTNAGGLNGDDKALDGRQKLEIGAGDDGDEGRKGDPSDPNGPGPHPGHDGSGGRSGAAGADGSDSADKPEPIVLTATRIDDKRAAKETAQGVAARGGLSELGYSTGSAAKSASGEQLAIGSGKPRLALPAGPSARKAAEEAKHVGSAAAARAADATGPVGSETSDRGSAPGERGTDPVDPARRASDPAGAGTASGDGLLTGSGGPSSRRPATAAPAGGVAAPTEAPGYRPESDVPNGARYAMGAAAESASTGAPSARPGDGGPARTGDGAHAAAGDGLSRARGAQRRASAGDATGHESSGYRPSTQPMTSPRFSSGEDRAVAVPDHQGTPVGTGSPMIPRGADGPRSLAQHQANGGESRAPGARAAWDVPRSGRDPVPVGVAAIAPQTGGEPGSAPSRARGNGVGSGSDRTPGPTRGKRPGGPRQAPSMSDSGGRATAGRTDGGIAVTAPSRGGARTEPGAVPTDPRSLRTPGTGPTPAAAGGGHAASDAVALAPRRTAGGMAVPSGGQRPERPNAGSPGSAPPARAHGGGRAPDPTGGRGHLASGLAAAAVVAPGALRAAGQGATLASNVAAQASGIPQAAQAAGAAAAIVPVVGDAVRDTPPGPGDSRTAAPTAGDGSVRGGAGRAGAPRTTAGDPTRAGAPRGRASGGADGLPGHPSRPPSAPQPSGATVSPAIAPPVASRSSDTGGLRGPQGTTGAAPAHVSRHEPVTGPSASGPSPATGTGTVAEPARPEPVPSAGAAASRTALPAASPQRSALGSGPGSIETPSAAASTRDGQLAATGRPAPTSRRTGPGQSSTGAGRASGPAPSAATTAGTGDAPIPADQGGPSRGQRSPVGGAPPSAGRSPGSGRQAALGTVTGTGGGPRGSAAGPVPPATGSPSARPERDDAIAAPGVVVPHANAGPSHRARPSSQKPTVPPLADRVATSGASEPDPGGRPGPSQSPATIAERGARPQSAAPAGPPTAAMGASPVAAQVAVPSSRRATSGPATVDAGLTAPAHTDHQVVPRISTDVQRQPARTAPAAPAQSTAPAGASIAPAPTRQGAPAVGGSSSQAAGDVTRSPATTAWPAPDAPDGGLPAAGSGGHGPAPAQTGLRSSTTRASARQDGLAPVARSSAPSAPNGPTDPAAGGNVPASVTRAVRGATPAVAAGTTAVAAAVADSSVPASGAPLTARAVAAPGAIAQSTGQTGQTVQTGLGEPTPPTGAAIPSGMVPGRPAPTRDVSAPAGGPRTDGPDVVVPTGPIQVPAAAHGVPTGPIGGASRPVHDIVAPSSGAARHVPSAPGPAGTTRSPAPRPQDDGSIPGALSSTAAADGTPVGTVAPSTPGMTARAQGGSQSGAVAVTGAGAPTPRPGTEHGHGPVRHQAPAASNAARSVAGPHPAGPEQSGAHHAVSPGNASPMTPVARPSVQTTGSRGVPAEGDRLVPTSASGAMIDSPAASSGTPRAVSRPVARSGDGTGPGIASPMPSTPHSVPVAAPAAQRAEQVAIPGAARGPAPTADPVEAGRSSLPIVGAAATVPVSARPAQNSPSSVNVPSGSTGSVRPAGAESGGPVPTGAPIRAAGTAPATRSATVPAASANTGPDAPAPPVAKGVPASIAPDGPTPTSHGPAAGRTGRSMGTGPSSGRSIDGQQAVEAVVPRSVPSIGSSTEAVVPPKAGPGAGSRSGVSPVPAPTSAPPPSSVRRDMPATTSGAQAERPGPTGSAVQAPTPVTGDRTMRAHSTGGARPADTGAAPAARAAAAPAAAEQPHRPPSSRTARAGASPSSSEAAPVVTPVTSPTSPTGVATAGTTRGSGARAPWIPAAGDGSAQRNGVMGSAGTPTVERLAPTSDGTMPGGQAVALGRAPQAGPITTGTPVQPPAVEPDPSPVVSVPARSAGRRAATRPPSQPVSATAPSPVPDPPASSGRARPDDADRSPQGPAQGVRPRTAPRRTGAATPAAGTAAGAQGMADRTPWTGQGGDQATGPGASGRIEQPARRHPTERRSETGPVARRRSVEGARGRRGWLGRIVDKVLGPDSDDSSEGQDG